ncbi:App1 family protein [Agilicoccus flavus]|uniref:App1 family protein n=1 Tax=Agilicoccus flavus TaxID=2775968 RepID=UPI001CF69DFA|nr:phosphatase domain-containing protein [Agilicoccus flavus]
MARPHAAALVEDAVNRKITDVLRGRGWEPSAIAHPGYGSESFVRVLGRILLTRVPMPDDEPDAQAQAASTLRERAEAQVRGWRAFMTAQAADAEAVITVGGREHRTRTDRSGYIDTVIEDHGLQPGWQRLTIAPVGGDPVPADVYIVAADQTFGVVSDIDDTVMITALPRPLIAAWNTFVLHEQARSVVPGMAPMYRDLLADHPGAPIFYLSTGAWNTCGNLTRFLRRHGYPAGPLLLTDWGPTNTGWFRSGQDHKRESLHRLTREFPHIQWVLVGDDGQHDPKIYGDFARDRADVVRAIGIRELTPAEQVLSHGIPVSNEGFAPRVARPAPAVRAPDGYGLLPKLKAILSGAEPLA